VSADDLLRAPVFGLSQADKERSLLPVLNELTALHARRCPEYGRIVEVVYGGRTEAKNLAAVPYLPVGLFKEHLLRSVPEAEVFKVLTSSGTTGQRPSRVVLDRATAQRQTQALAAIMQTVLGAERLPMLLVESPDVIRDRRSFSARGAGLLGMMTFGRDHTYALRPGMELDRDAVLAFLARHGSRRFLVFGFTFMVWQYLYTPLAGMGLDLSQGVLIHSGGWKTLQDRAVTNAVFRERLRADLGIARAYNFYGMVEQVGSVFLEGDDGYLYVPAFADVVIRDPATWEDLPPGREGVVEVLSALPSSYPGHAILTEDLGVVHGVDDGTCGRKGKYFSVLGRVPKTELRGCSDTHAQSLAGTHAG
jgi:hypothetical protein